jgi:hypothetical protein
MCVCVCDCVRVCALCVMCDVCMCVYVCMCVQVLLSSLDVDVDPELNPSCRLGHVIKITKTGVFSAS